MDAMESGHEHACPDCGGSDMTTSNEGCDVCTGCGLIQEGGMVREARPSHHEDGGAAAPRESSAAARERRRLGRAERRHRHTPSTERWVKTLRDMAGRAGLNHGISQTAVAVYRRAANMPGWKNRKQDYQIGLLVACMFHACNIHRAHRTPAELCSALDVDPKKARKMVKVVESAAAEVGGVRRPRPAAPRGACARAGPADTDVPHEVLPRCAHRIPSIPMEKLPIVWRLARLVYERVRPAIDNHRPDTITSGLLAVVLDMAQIPVSDADIASACMVAPNTVRALANKITAIVESTPP
eukprot:jgi/Tetstr1/454044/TSEL_040963.t1